MSAVLRAQARRAKGRDVISLAVDVGLNDGAIVVLDEDASLLHEFQIGAPQPNPRKFTPYTYQHRLGLIRRQVIDAWNTMMEPLAKEPGSLVPIGITVEEPLIGRSARVSLQLYGVFAVVIDALNELTPNKELCRDLNVQTLKKYLGVSQKAYIVREVWKRWRYDGKTTHLCDAYGMARFALEHPTGWDEFGAKKKKLKRALTGRERRVNTIR